MSWEHGSAREITLSVLPSSTPNQICLVGIRATSQYVKVGKVSGNMIRTQDEIFNRESSREGDLIGSTSEQMVF